MLFIDEKKIVNSEKWYLGMIKKYTKVRDEKIIKINELEKPIKKLESKLSQVQEEIKSLIKERDEIYG